MNNEPAARQPSRSRRKVLRDWAESFIVALALALLIKYYLFEIYKIPTSSMEPTLVGKLEGGDRIIVNKVKYRFRPPRRWDVFVFSSPEEGSAKNLIKRVTGLPGEKLAIIHGDLYVNDKSVPEEKPLPVQQAVYVRNEAIGFDDDTWALRFEPNGLTAAVQAAGTDRALAVRCPQSGSLKYKRRITNFHLREGAGRIRCIHRYDGEEYNVPEASTLNSLITCPNPQCGRMVDLFNIENNSRSIGIMSENSTITGRYDPLRSGMSSVGDMKIAFDLNVQSCEGYAGVIIVENDREYVFVLAAAASGRESTLVIKDYATKAVLETDRILFTLPNGFRGRACFENVDNRESVYINGERVYSRVFDWGRPDGRGARVARLALIFDHFNGLVDNVTLDRDLYYTNRYDAGVPAQFAVNPQEPLQLGGDQYFGMGDNSPNSNDSRYFGPIPGSNVMGNAVMVFPWIHSSRWKIVE